MACTWMLEGRGAREISQTMSKTTRMHRMRLRTRTALGTRRKWLKMQSGTSERVEWSSRHRTHRLRSRLSRPSLLVDGKGPALEKPAHMHRGTRHLEVLEGADRTFAFGRVESGDKELGAN
ncbi:hypothetical protein SCLCIDRAFT_1210942, partial [Scleroderma citrinum Foug A]